MDMRWDEYVDMFGFTPAEYIDSPQYKAKYGDNQVIFSMTFQNGFVHTYISEMLARSY